MRAERTAMALVAAAALWVAPEPGVGQAGTKDVVTRIELVRSTGRPARGVPVDEVVAAWSPRRTQTRTRPPNNEEFSVITRGKAFRPDFLAVPVGSRVRFPNEDEILHNVFSVSEGNAFDLGLYQRGEGEAVRFQNPGLVRVFCNVHRDMFAFVLVLDSESIVQADRDGRVVLGGLPPGPGVLTLWHPRGEVQTFDFPGPEAIPESFELEIGRRQVPAHSNKLGQPYRAARRYDG